MIEMPQSFVTRQECEKTARQNGLHRPLGGPSGGAGFASATVPGRIHLAAAEAKRRWFTALDHHGAIDELARPPAALSGPSLSRHAFGSLRALYGALSSVYQLAASLTNTPFALFKAKEKTPPQTTEAGRLVWSNGSGSKTAHVKAPDHPSETFHVLKEKEIRQHGEYRTRRLVLAAWDRMETNGEFAAMGM
ncbi:hypothetical protein ACTTAL_17470 [Rhodobacter capsulatus]|uniref:hypothetical protein n=1 Tax=Rhodobacter capsulatus TaxID=1061 RepID=UPI0003D3507C|nr:hypothetical protein [Rhodobacter capsulatus]ETD87257.1 restriction endonuclease [Rhodobacter capsulatus YW2]